MRQRRASFDRVAESYNRVRPRYPEELFNALELEAGLEEDDRLLELGPGTGQATLSLARRGYKIHAVELGEEMARVARRELADYPRVKVITGSFEQTELAELEYALVYSATAFHWISPEAKFSKPHRLLRAGGHLAIIHTRHLSAGMEDEFFRASQPVYAKYEQVRERVKTPLRAPQPEEILPAPLDESLFRLTHFQSFPVTLHYTAKRYCELLSTYSPQLLLPEAEREAFLGEMRELILAEFDGHIARDFGMSLTLAIKL